MFDDFARWFWDRFRKGLVSFSLVSGVSLLISLLIAALDSGERLLLEDTLWIGLIFSVVVGLGVILWEWLANLRKQVQAEQPEEPRRDADFYRLLLAEAAPNLTFVLDADGKVSTWNEHQTRILGFLPEEAVGLRFMDLYAPGTFPFTAANEILRKAQQHGLFHREGWLVSKRGVRFLVDSLVIPIRGASEGDFGYLVLNRDLSRRPEKHLNLLQTSLGEEGQSRYKALGFRESTDQKTSTLDGFKDRIRRVFTSDGLGGRGLSWRNFTGGSGHRDGASVLLDDNKDRRVPPEESSTSRAPFLGMESKGRAESSLAGQKFSQWSGSHLGEAYLYQLITAAQGALGHGILVLEGDRIAFVNQSVRDFLGIDFKDIQTWPELLAFLRESGEFDLSQEAEGILAGGYFPTSGRIRVSRGNQPVELGFVTTRFDGKVSGGVQVILFDDLTSQIEFEREITFSRETLKLFAVRQQKAIEEERKRISREIHDGLGSMLMGLKMDLILAEERAGLATAHRGPSRVNYEEMRDKIDRVMQASRIIATELRPSLLDDFGLVPALDWTLQEFQKQTGITCQMETAVEIPMIKGEINTTAFRIFQEALTNVRKHASPENVWVKIGITEDELLLSLEDDGRGISPEDVDGFSSTSLGLLGMRERAALMNGEALIEPREAGGTRVRIRLPLSEGQGE
jgi:PAS domain S-box-containing protein